MKKFLLAATAITAICAGNLSAQDYDDSGWYLRGNAGYGAHSDAEFDQSVLRGDLESQANVAGSVGLGYDFGNNWRLELDGDTLWTDMGQVGNSPGSYAKLRTTSAMVNALYDFDDFGRFAPYVGAGIGLVQGNLKAEAHDFINGAGASIVNPACLGGQSGSCSVDDKDTSIGWQLLAGLGYDVTDKLTWDTHYSYMNAGSGGLDFDGNYAPSALSTLGALAHKTELQDVAAHTLMTGFRYRFGQPAPKPTVTCWNGAVESSYASCAERPAPKPATYSCWDGSVVANRANCAPRPQLVTCWDGTTANSQATCPARPAPKTYSCWDGSVVSDLAVCPVQPTPQPIVQSYNNCGPSNVAIFNVPLSETPKQMSRLGTMPEFGDSHGLTPSQFFEKLQTRYAESQTDKAYLNYLFKSMGYSNGFSDAQSYMFSEEVLPVGTKGMLGLGKAHHYKYSILPSNDRDRQAFRIQSANGSVVHFMKTCGNYMYACNQ